LAIRFKYLGQEYQADTPEEAIKLEALLRAATEKKAKADPAFARKVAQVESGWTEEKLRHALNKIGPMQMKMLVRIWENETIDAEDLAKELGLPSQVALAGVLSGLSKQLKPLNVRPNDILQIDVLWTGRNKTRIFAFQPGFEAVAEEYGFADSFLMDEESNRKQKKK